MHRTALLVALVCGCSMITVASRQDPLRAALDARDLSRAEAIAGQGLDGKIHGATPVLFLEYASVLQAAGRYRESAYDFGVADKALDVNDMALDDTMRRTGVPSSTRYAYHMGWTAALNYPYVTTLPERFLMPTLNMVNYLALGDTSGAQVEGRRLALATAFARSFSPASPAYATRALSGILEGFAFEQTRDATRACDAYREAIEAGGAELAPAIPSTRVGKTIRPTACDRAEPSPHAEEILIVVGYGRPPLKITEVSQMKGSGGGSVPVATGASLRDGREAVETPEIAVDGAPIPSVEALDIATIVRQDFEDAKVHVVTPVTVYSWETLPAHVVVARAVVGEGTHAIDLRVRDEKKSLSLRIEPGGYVTVAHFVLR